MPVFSSSSFALHHPFFRLALWGGGGFVLRTNPTPATVSSHGSSLRDSYTLPVAADAVGVGAHAHYLVKEMKMTATLPGGDVKTLLLIKDWDFAWQDRYYFQQLVPLPKGTRLDVEIHWDNSAENLRNPSSPPVRVTWGEESKDEMGSISLITVPHEESDLAVLREDVARRARQLVRERMMADPTLAKKVARILAE